MSCVQARVNAGPVRDVPRCSLDAEGPIVDPPAISGELETGLCDDVGIGHHVWHHSRVQLPQCCSVPVKTGQPGEDVADCPQLSFRLRGVAAVAVGRLFLRGTESSLEQGGWEEPVELNECKVLQALNKFWREHFPGVAYGHSRRTVDTHPPLGVVRRGWRRLQLADEAVCWGQQWP